MVRIKTPYFRIRTNTYLEQNNTTMLVRSIELAKRRAQTKGADSNFPGKDVDS